VSRAALRAALVGLVAVLMGQACMNSNGWEEIEQKPKH
jgi:hypothetical protein